MSCSLSSPHSSSATHALHTVITYTSTPPSYSPSLRLLIPSDSYPPSPTPLFFASHIHVWCAVLFETSAWLAPAALRWSSAPESAGQSVNHPRRLYMMSMAIHFSFNVQHTFIIQLLGH